MSTGANVLGLFQNDPTYRTMRNIKDPRLQALIDQGMGDYSTTRAAGNDALGTYISKYLANQGRFDTMTEGDISRIGDVTGGGLASSLAALRGQTYEDSLKSGDLASQYLLRSMKGSALGEPGGSSSYFARQGLANLAPIQAQAALARDAAARSDLGYTTDLGLGLAGKAQGLLGSLSSYGLQPQQVRQNLMTSNLGNLAGISSLDQANSIFGVQRETTDLDKWIKFLNSQQATSNQDIGTMANLYGSAAGGGGGGGGGGGSM